MFANCLELTIHKALVLHAIDLALKETLEISDLYWSMHSLSKTRMTRKSVSKASTWNLKNFIG